ncbi:MAG: cysteine desulfurase [Gemmatimonadetes bacterium]|nr:cysteine desulfurase [Gemmatimonadota bacterium]
MDTPDRTLDLETGPAYDIERIRADFPILGRLVHGHPLAYLDNAATSQKPYSVIQAVDAYYREINANVHRGAHELSIRATEAYEEAREVVADHIGAPSASEVIFVRGATEAINLVAWTWGAAHVAEGDEILLTKMEHHSNLVPWQILAGRAGATVHYVDVEADGTLVMDDYDRLLSDRTCLVAVTHVSNTLGVVNPVAEIAQKAREADAICVVDGAQAAPHMQLDVQAIGCDFYAFSGHKMLAPTGIGALWGRREILEHMPPWQGGGEMISEVRLEGFTAAQLPHKFEAGTPNIAGAIGFAEAIRYLQRIGLERVHAWESDLTAYALERLDAVDGLEVFGPRKDRVGVISFRYADIHAHDLATILDQKGVAIRAGHHCNQPLMTHLGVDATARASVYLYNTRSEIDALVDALGLAAKLFGVA